MFASKKKTIASISLVVIVGLVFLAVNLTGNKTPKEVTLVTHDSFVYEQEIDR
ncbi:MAG: hypothetical protein WDO06_02455 [Actinomycetota bacterium]